MEIAVVLGLVAVVAAISFWVWRTAKSQSETEAYKGQNKAQDEKIRALQEAQIAAYEAKRREDRLRAEEIVHNNDAAGAARMLRDATRNDPN